MNMQPIDPGDDGSRETATVSRVDDVIDVQRIIAVARRRWRIFASAVAICLLGAVLLTATAKPQYTSSATVMINSRTERVTNVQDVLSDLPADPAVVDSEVEVVRSRQTAERVVAALDLQQDPEFNPLLTPPKGLRAILNRITGSSSLSPAQAQAMANEAWVRDVVVSQVLARTSAQRSGLTYVIYINFTSSNPQKSATIANAFAEAYLTQQVEAKYEATRSAAEFIRSRLDQLREQVIADEAAVQQYRVANNLLSASGTTLTEQEISAYNQSYAIARAQLAEDEARLRTARAQLGRGSTGDDVGEALGSPVVQGLRQQRAEISKRLADLEGRYGERHPEMLRAQRELSDVDQQIQAEIKRILSNLEAKVEVSRQRAAAVSGTVGTARGTLAQNNRATVGLAELARRAEASRALYESFLTRYKETSTQQGIGQPDARIVSRAQLGPKSSPNPPLNLALGLIVGMGLGLGGVIAAEVLANGLNTSEDVERRLGVACIGSIPLLSSVAETSDGLAPADYMVSKPLSSYSEAFRNLLLAVRLSAVGRSTKVVALTSALPGEGKTTTSLGLARIAALQGERVLLVDCDLRRRNLKDLVEADTSAGLLEVLSGAATLTDAVRKDKLTAAELLPLLPGPVTAMNVFASGSFEKLLSDLRNNYDLIILDTAPVLPLVDTRVLAPQADVVVVLTRWRKTPERAVEAALKILKATSARVAGVLLTQVDVKAQAASGYGDIGYYANEYKRYYVES